MVSVARSPSNSPVGGGRVVCADIDPVRGKETVGLVVRAGGKGLDIACDVSVEKQVREWPTAPRSGSESRSALSSMPGSAPAAASRRDIEERLGKTIVVDKSFVEKSAATLATCQLYPRPRSVERIGR